MSTSSGRLSTLAAAWVIMRRDFVAILWSRSFIFFLLGPLFPVVVGVMAGSVGHSVEKSVQSQLGVAMSQADTTKLLAARKELAARTGDLPELVSVKVLAPGEKFDPQAALSSGSKSGTNVAAIITGSLTSPHLTGPQERVEAWQGPVSLIAARAAMSERGDAAPAYPKVALTPTVVTSHADQHHGQMITAQAGQTLLFLLTMLLAGMVLSNLVEEKGNKIIEILAAAIPLDALFLGKLFAMLAVSLVGIAVWGACFGLFHMAVGHAMPGLPTPAVGWALFVALGVVYFAMGYLLLGAVFLAIGSLATTVREVQTLSMPVTMMQLLVFFFASYALAKPGSPVELAAMIMPFSSPFAMLAKAAEDSAVWPHLLAIGWQAVCVGVFVKVGAKLFRSRVMKSGSGGGSTKRRGWFRRARAVA